MVNNIGTRMWKLTKKLCGTQAAPASSEAIGCTRLSQHDGRDQNNDYRYFLIGPKIMNSIIFSIIDLCETFGTRNLSTSKQER